MAAQHGAHKSMEEAKQQQQPPPSSAGLSPSPRIQQQQHQPPPAVSPVKSGLALGVASAHRSTSLDPFARVTSTMTPHVSRPSTPERRAASAARRRALHPIEPLPPNMHHLHYAHHQFPLFLLQAAARLFQAKCRDLAIAYSKEKERRFVWLVCRQSMGGGSGGGADDGSDLLADATQTADETAGSSELLAFRVPDAALGPNALRELCSFLANDTRFGILQLSGNILGDEGSERLANLLRHNSSLVSLDVRGTGMGQHAFAALLDAVAEHPSLTSLDASSLKSDGRMFLGSVGAKALGRLLKRNTVLRKLHLSNTSLGGGNAGLSTGGSEGVGSIVRGLCLNRTLISLDLSANDVGPRTGARLAEAIAAVRSVEVLHLSENSLGDTGIALLSESLRKMECLRVLDLRKNKIGLAGLTILSDCVGELISLQELLLDGNAMADFGSGAAARVAAKGLASFGGGMSAATGLEYVDSMLKRLHLSEKRISPRLLLNSSLRTLSLANAGVSDRTIEELARVLASHKGIQNLLLQQNQLQDAAAFALAGLVRCSTSLRAIHLADNAVSDEGGLALCTALATPASNVSFLSLRVNQCGPASATAVLHALALKRDLHVDFAGNTVPWVLYSKVSELSSRNRRTWEASLSTRFRDEFEGLQARHEHRLQVEDQCLDSIEELAALQSQLQALEHAVPLFKEQHSAETKVMQAEFEQWNHKLHEAHAEEQRAEGLLSAHSKDLEGKIASLRKAIEKEQRFIAQAEKLIPAALEEHAAEERLAETDVVDLKRDLRLLTSDRNEQMEACDLAMAELRRLIRDMEIKTGGGSNGAGATGKKGKGANGRPSSRGGRRSRTPSTSPRKSERAGGSSRPGTASKRKATTTAAAASAASAAGSRSSSRPPSARPKSSGGTVPLEPRGMGSKAPSTPVKRALASNTNGSTSAAKPKAAAAAAAAAAVASPAKPKKGKTSSKKKGGKKSSSGATSPEPAAAPFAAATPRSAGDSSLVALAQAQAAES